MKEIRNERIRNKLEAKDYERYWGQKNVKEIYNKRI
jgi:hypothetical protein